jgi:threonyl-tRNA synthetase
VELDDRNEKIGYKIREWETRKVRYMLVVGDKERQNGTVSVRLHKQGDRGPATREEIIRELRDAVDAKSYTL